VAVNMLGPVCLGRVEEIDQLIDGRREDVGGGFRVLLLLEALLALLLGNMADS